MLNQPFDANRPGAPPEGEQPRPSGSRGKLAWMIAIPLVLAALALYWFRTRAPAPAPPAPAPVVATAPANADAVAEAADQKAANVLRGTGEGTDEKLRQELGTLSADASWRGWVAATPDLIEGLAVIIANVADDDDPRRRLAPLRPDGRFEVVERGGSTVESPEGEHRYDAAVGVLTSLDTHALATLWHTFHPLISIAYRAVGRPGVSLDQAAGHALMRVADTPIPDRPGSLQLVGKLWLYTDPDVEKQGSIEKLLLRMGAANAHKLQAKALEIRAALRP